MAETLAARRPRAASKSGAPPPNPRATEGDNSRAAEAAEQAQLLSVVTKLRAKRTEIAKVKVTMDALKADEREVFAMAKLQGFDRKALTPLLEDLEVKGSRKDLIEEEAKRARWRRMLGLPHGDDGKQRDLLPEEVRDEVDWRAAGYSAGIRDDPPQPPTDGQGTVPPRFVGVWLEGWHDGHSARTAANGAAMIAKQKANAGKAAAEPAREPTKAELKAEEKRVRESLDNLKGETAGAGVHEPGTNGDSDGFEATPDELAAQIGRKTDADEAV